MDGKPNISWHYYKLMVGSYAWAFDHLISKFAEITKDPRVKQWFFIRFLDEDGIHIRLRLGVAAADSTKFDREVYPKLHNMVLELSSLPLEEAPKLVTVPMPDFDLSGFKFGVKRDKYQPEIEIYGGETGVAIAEHLFQVSSEIAVKVICEERSGNVSRKDIAPALMKAALEEFKISKSTSDFLTDYKDYWMKNVPDNDTYVIAFENKSRQLVEAGIPVVRPDDQYDPLLSTALQQWRKSLRETQAAFKKTEQYSEILTERLLFYFIHLMNNRLGFLFFDEIYLAVLLNGRGDKKAV